MKVHYKKSIIDKITNAIQHARKIRKTISCIELTKEEAEDLYDGIYKDLTTGRLTCSKAEAIHGTTCFGQIVIVEGMS